VARPSWIVWPLLTMVSGRLLRLICSGDAGRQWPRLCRSGIAGRPSNRPHPLHRDRPISRARPLPYNSIGLGCPQRSRSRHTKEAQNRRKPSPDDDAYSTPVIFALKTMPSSTRHRRLMPRQTGGRSRENMTSGFCFAHAQHRRPRAGEISQSPRRERRPREGADDGGDAIACGRSVYRLRFRPSHAAPS
jgi:hypothetical protein